MILLLENLNVFLNHFLILHQSYLNNLYCKRDIYILSSYPWRFHVQENNHNHITCNLLNFFFEIMDNIWQWTFRKSCTINMSYFVRNGYIILIRNGSIILITIFINFSNFFFLSEQKKVCTFLCFPLDSFANYFIKKIIIIVWPVLENFMNFVRHIKS